jgi:hypothetical protein
MDVLFVAAGACNAVVFASIAGADTWGGVAGAGAFEEARGWETGRSEVAVPISIGVGSCCREWAEVCEGPR